MGTDTGVMYNDVERRLSYRLVISIEQSIKLLPVLSREMDTVPLDFQVTEKGHFIDLFICGSPAQKLQDFLYQYRPITTGDCHVVRMRTEEMDPAARIMEKIDSIGEAVRGSLYVKSDKIYVEYRISNEGISFFTKIAGEIIGMQNHIRIVDLGPGASGIHALNEVNGRIPLTVVGYEVDILRDLNVEENCFIEYNFHGEDNKGFKAILYCGDKKEVRYFDSPFLREVNKLSVEQRIPKAAILAKPSKGRYRSFTFLPSAMVENHLSILYSAASHCKSCNFKLLAVRKYTSDVWSWV